MELEKVGARRDWPDVDRILQPRSTGTRGWWRAVTPVTVSNYRRGPRPPPPGVLVVMKPRGQGSGWPPQFTEFRASAL